MLEIFLLNPNIIYLALVLGVILAVMAVLTPGSGIFEIGALFSFLIGGWGVYNLPINVWALGLLLLGVGFFWIAIRRGAQHFWLGSAIASLILGTLFVLRGPVWWQPAVHPLLGVAASILLGGLIWLFTVKIVEAESTRPVHDLEALIGREGEAKTDIQHSGTAQIAGELWSAAQP